MALKAEAAFTRFYDGVEAGTCKSLQDAFETLKRRPYLLAFLKALHSPEEWEHFKNAQYDAYLAGYNEGVTQGIKAAQKVTAKTEEVTEEAPAVKEEVKADPQPEKTTMAEFRKLCTATAAADTTCSDYEEIRTWCLENNVRRYGKGFLLSPEEYEKWCDHIGFKDKRFPGRTTVRAE